MKSRVFTLTSLFMLIVAMMAATSAFAQTSPADDVYNPNGEVLDVVEGGGTDDAGTAPEATKAPSTENGAAVCDEADGRDAAGNATTYGSDADCAPATQTVSSGDLPFTGFQAGLVALLGLGLVGGGFAMRRVARGGSHDIA